MLSHQLWGTEGVESIKVVEHTSSLLCVPWCDKNDYFPGARDQTQGFCGFVVELGVSGDVT